MHIGRMMQIERRQIVASEMYKVSKQVIPSNLFFVYTYFWRVIPKG